MVVCLVDIFIYKKDLGSGQIKAIRYLLDVLQKRKLFANLKKCRFYKNRICFLGYIIFEYRVKVKDKQIKAMKNLLKPTSLKDI